MTIICGAFFTPWRDLCLIVSFVSVLCLGCLEQSWSIFCNGSTCLSNKPECQQKGLNWSISFIPGPFIGYQRLGDLLTSVLSWSLFSERGAGELSAGNTRIRSRANNNSRKEGRIQGGVEAEANLEGPLYPGRPCLSGIFYLTSSWVGSPIMAPGRTPTSRNLCMYMYVSHSVMSDSLPPYGPLASQAPLCPWNSPGKNTGVGSHFLLRGSSPARDRTSVSCTAGGFFTAFPHQGGPRNLCSAPPNPEGEHLCGHPRKAPA